MQNQKGTKVSYNSEEIHVKREILIVCLIHGRSHGEGETPPPETEKIVVEK